MHQYPHTSAVFNSITSPSSFMELPPFNYLSPTPDSHFNYQYLPQSKQCSPGFDFSCLPTPSPSLKSEVIGSLAAPLLPWSKLDVPPCSQSMPPSAHIFTATLPPPPSQLSKCYSPWMDGSWTQTPQLSFSSTPSTSGSARRWSQPATFLSLINQPPDTSAPVSTVNELHISSSNDPKSSQNWAPQRSSSLGAHSLMNILKPQLQLTDYLVRPFAGQKHPPKMCSEPKQPSIQEEDEEQPRPNTSSRPDTLEISPVAFEFAPVAEKAENSSSAFNCCEFSSIPSTSAQLSFTPSFSYGSSSASALGTAKSAEQYTKFGKRTSCEEAICSPSSDIIGSASSNLSLASTSPAIQDPLSPEAIFYFKNSINSSFDSSFDTSTSPRQEMIIDHLHRRCHERHKIVRKSEQIKSCASPPLNLGPKSPTECRKRHKSSDKASHFEQDLHKMPNLVPETPPLTAQDIDDAENTAPPPMLNPFDSPLSPIQPSTLATVGFSKPEESVSPVSPTLTLSTAPSTPKSSKIPSESFLTSSFEINSSSGVSSAYSSITIFSPCEADSTAEPITLDISAKRPSTKALPAHERRRKYASKRRRTPPKVISSQEAVSPDEKLDEKIAVKVKFPRPKTKHSHL
uniref:Uncharacterized protein n=1 Tax=Ditylenchus dipsaci TaxID=166011 RepID=A0A915D2Q9_9BILA